MKKAIFTAGVLFLVGRAFCADLLVPSQYPTIQAAIDATATGDTVIIAPGTYTDIGNQLISIFNKAITVRSTDPNNPSVVDSTIIDCCGLSHGISISYSNSVVEGLTITNGGYSSMGGGVSIYGSGFSPVIRNCVIRNNSADGYGGGIYSESRPTIVGCRIIGNHSLFYGGGLYGFFTIIDCNISENSAVQGGGGIYSPGAVRIKSSEISGNISSGGRRRGFFKWFGD